MRYEDHEFDPVTPEEQARRDEEAELARRIRREVLRVQRGEADGGDPPRRGRGGRAPRRGGGARASRTPPPGQRPVAALLGLDPRARGQRRVLPLPDLHRGDVLSEHRGDVLGPPTSTCATRASNARCSCCASVRYGSKQRYRRTTHSAVVERLRERGIELRDALTPSEIIEK